MALHHPEATVLALSILLLGILGFLQASDTPLIPVDQLTIEQAYLEVHLIQRQLRHANPLNITAEQRDIVQRMSNFSLYRYSKPNDLLPNSHRQLMTHFREAFTNWPHPPLIPGTVQYELLRGWAITLLYSQMLLEVEKALQQANLAGIRVHQIDADAFIRAHHVQKQLRNVYFGISKKFEDNSDMKSSEAAKYLQQLEGYIKTARRAVMALPKFDENNQLIHGSSTEQMIFDGQLPSGNLPGASSSKSSKPPPPNNKLFHHLKRPHIWGPWAILAGVVGYHFLKGHSVSSSGDLDLMFPSKIPLDSTFVNTSVASEGSNHFWCILLIVGLVALIVIGWWWYCFKTRRTPHEDEAKTASKVSKRASKSRRLASTKDSPSPA